MVRTSLPTEKWMIISKCLWVRIYRKTPSSVWECLVVFNILNHKALTPPGKQEAYVLAQIWIFKTDPSVDTADWICRKKGYHSTQMGWHIAKDVKLPFIYSELINTIISVFKPISKATAKGIWGYLPEFPTCKRLVWSLIPLISQGGPQTSLQNDRRL